MNLVGKIFTVLIFVMSLVFMTFTSIVYSTHKNWMDIVTNPKTGLQESLKKAVAERETLREKTDELNKEVETEKARHQKVLAQLENENQELRQERINNEKKIQELDQAVRQAVAAMDATQKQLATLRKDNETLRADIKAAQTDRDAQFKIVVKLTDEVNNLANERVALEKRMLQLTEELGKARAANNWAGVNPNGPYKEKSPPAGLEGLVTAVTGQDMVEISIGSDDGVMKGHKFEVVRMAGGTANYVARIEVIQTTPDRAVCRVDIKMQRSPIQRGDRVLASLTTIK
jgi:chemotaxis protein histidine kinase CheA